MKNQALFSSKDKSKILKCRLLQFLFGALRVNYPKADVCKFSKNVKSKLYHIANSKTRGQTDLDEVVINFVVCFMVVKELFLLSEEAPSHLHFCLPFLWGSALNP